MSIWPAVMASMEAQGLVKSSPPPTGAPEDAAAYYARMVREGEAIYAARLALGDFEPKKEQTFWQWLIGKKP